MYLSPRQIGTVKAWLSLFRHSTKRNNHSYMGEGSDQIPNKAPPSEKRTPSPSPSTTTTTTSIHVTSPSTTTTSIHVTALDAIVNVNTLFTAATFIGLSLNPPSPDPTGRTPAGCLSSFEDMRRLQVYEMVSFSFFLYSSLIAQALKLTINLLNIRVHLDVASKTDINYKVLRFGVLGSAVGSVMGCLFLMISMVSIIEVKLGSLACGGYTVWAATTLIVLVSSALFVYISASVYAILQF